MKEIQKRHETEDETEGSGDVIGKRPRVPTLSEAEEEEEELLLTGFIVEEETLMEVMKVLEEEISYTVNNGNTNANPSSSVIYSPSSSFVTINGNEESCGPSFSDSASTVMANVDMGGISISYFMGPTNGFPFPSSGPMDFLATTEEEQGWPEIGDVSVSAISGEGINEGCGSEVGESDDEWLARVLNGSLFEFEE